MEFVSNTKMSHSIRVSLRNIHTCLLLLCSRERKQPCIKLHFSEGFFFNMTFKQLLPNMQNVTKETRNCGKSQHLLFVPGKGSKNPLNQYFKYLYSSLGPAFLVYSGNRFGSTFDFSPCFLLEDPTPWMCPFKLQDLDWSCYCLSSRIQHHVQSTVHCLNLVHPHLPVFTRYK